MKRDPLFYCYFGRDWVRDEGLQLTLLVLPAPSLMRRGEEGYYTLTGLGLRVRFVAPWGYFDNPWRMEYVAPGPIPERKGWRWPLRLDIHTDADEIAFRRAEGAGHRFPGRRQPEPPLWRPDREESF